MSEHDEPTVDGRDDAEPGADRGADTEPGADRRDDAGPDVVVRADGDRAPEPDVDVRSDGARARDHATIERLSDELLPALVARLVASELGEIEVREGDWRIRLRMPAGTGESRPAHRAGAPVRASGPLPGASVHARGAASGVAPSESDPLGAVAAGGRRSGGDGGRVVAHAPKPRAVATSPGVGFYAPKPGLVVGSRVRKGDRLGTVDVLGVALEVVAPTDGVVGGSYAEPGEAVEYGQELVRIELAGAAHDGPGTLGADERAGTAPDVLGVAPDGLQPASDALRPAPDILSPASDVLPPGSGA